jgi:dCMP deaminase
VEHRITRDQAFMQTAEVWSRRSTCMRRNVGAVIVVNNRIVSIGYNGAPPGEPHCDGKTCVPPGLLGCTRAIHAEVNAIDFLPAQFNLAPKHLYITESPCPACAAKIIAGPVVKNFLSVTFLHEYRVDSGIKTLIIGGITVQRMTPSGYLVAKVIEKNSQLSEVLIK